MSELTNAKSGRIDLRWKLLTSVSALALIASVSVTPGAMADDTDRPTIWIELGGQLSRLNDTQEAFSPTLMANRPSDFSPSTKFDKPPSNSIDETGKIALEPSGSDWIFSGSVRFGRSSNNKDAHQQNYVKPFATHITFGTYHLVYTAVPKQARFADTAVKVSQSHLIVDFQAGKDVGLGLFGNKDGSSTISVGVRFAQFNSKTNIALKSDPDWHWLYKYGSYPSLGVHLKFPYASVYHSNAASLQAARNFHGVGPSLSWNASLPFAGNPQDSSLSFDWGLNASLLFGRQSAKTHHQTTGRYHPKTFHPTLPYHPITYQGPAQPDHSRSRNIAVPNVGGFAGLTFRLQNFKVSAGYRADMFFGAMDGGIDARKTENVGFYGPFASVSIGLGG